MISICKGTGIFLTPTKVIQYTNSVGIALLLWLAGAVAAMAGILVYMEFGLTTPRYYFNGRGKISVPRNGAEIHYVSPKVTSFKITARLTLYSSKTSFDARCSYRPVSLELRLYSLPT